MAAPTFEGAGTGTGNAAGYSLALPAHQDRDLLVVITETGGEALPEIGAPWIRIDGHTGGGATRMFIDALPCTGSSHTCNIPDSGNHQVSISACFRGVRIDAGMPTGGLMADSSGMGSPGVVSIGTVSTIAGPDVTSLDQRVLVAANHNIDSTTSPFTNNPVASNGNVTWTKLTDFATGAGNGGAVALWMGTPTATGPTGNINYTQTVAGAGSIWASMLQPPLSGAVSVTPGNGTQAHSSTSPAIAAVGGAVSVTPVNAAQGQVATAPTIAAKSSIAPVNAAQGQTATSPSLAAKSIIAPNGASQSHAATSPAIASVGAVVPANASQGQASTSPTVTTKSVIAPINAGQGQTATSPSVGTNHWAISPDDASHGANNLVTALFLL